ncbi:hypothetical protein ml_159 [Mollivirus sibericum]|uniref:hypothetical protein n=1 Tax=Mollivirus sibericum TaxID=1678078 RepID=UPI0006B2DE5A|nr:hypothetical protein ml_159 [Mollivirus sibericum]ALD61961.1 hypothetical protein ml_159 [Mollivirus sibericum]
MDSPTTTTTLHGTMCLTWVDALGLPDVLQGVSAFLAVHDYLSLSSTNTHFSDLMRSPQSFVARGYIRSTPGWSSVSFAPDGTDDAGQSNVLLFMALLKLAHLGQNHQEHLDVLPFRRTDQIQVIANPLYEPHRDDPRQAADGPPETPFGDDDGNNNKDQASPGSARKRKEGHHRPWTTNKRPRLASTQVSGPNGTARRRGLSLADVSRIFHLILMGSSCLLDMRVPVNVVLMQLEAATFVTKRACPSSATFRLAPLAHDNHNRTLTVERMAYEAGRHASTAMLEAMEHHIDAMARTSWASAHPLAYLPTESGFAAVGDGASADPRNAFRPFTRLCCVHALMGLSQCLDRGRPRRAFAALVARLVYAEGPILLARCRCYASNFRMGRDNWGYLHQLSGALRVLLKALAEPPLQDIDPFDVIAMCVCVACGLDSAMTPTRCRCPKDDRGDRDDHLIDTLLWSALHSSRVDEWTDSLRRFFHSNSDSAAPAETCHRLLRDKGVRLLEASIKRTSARIADDADAHQRRLGLLLAPCENPVPCRETERIEALT